MLAMSLSAVMIQARHTLLTLTGNERDADDEFTDYGQ
jgi:hypothetical protein